MQQPVFWEEMYLVTDKPGSLWQHWIVWCDRITSAKYYNSTFFFNLKVLDRQFLITLHTTIRQLSLIFRISQMEKVKREGVKWLDHKPSNSRSWKYRPWYRKLLEQMLNFQYWSIQYSNILTEGQNTARKILQSSHTSSITKKGILALTCHLTACKEPLIHFTKTLHSLLSAHFSQIILIQVVAYCWIWCSGKKRGDFDFLKTSISACWGRSPPLGRPTARRMKEPTE